MTDPELPYQCNDAVEHAMRVCTDELVVLEVAAAAPGSPQAYAAVGRLLAASGNLPLADCTPLVTLCTGASTDGQWRQRVGETPDSLWSQLAFLEAMFGAPDDHTNPPLDRLLTLRDREADALRV